MDDLSDYINKAVEEEATGMKQAPGNLVFYFGENDPVDDPLEIRRRLEDGETLEVPGAGAGTYRELARFLDLGPVEPLETMSSAGDWTFNLPELEATLFQENRYPYRGFNYKIGR